MKATPAAMDAMRTVRRTLRRCMRPFLRAPLAPDRMALDDLLYMAGKTLSMADLLVAVPKRICTMLHLSGFQVFLRDGMHYRPEPQPGGPVLREISFRSSCSMLAHLKREGRPVPVNEAAPDAWMMLATPEELAALRLLGAQMLLPLHGRTGLVGFATMARSSTAGFSVADRLQLQSLGAQLGSGLETAQFQKSLSDEAVRRAQATRELELAREVQERLLPQGLPTVPGLQISGVYRSAAQIGGDYYDVFLTSSGQVCCVIADVSGKGVPAALLMATLRASLRSLMLQERPLPEVLQALNRLLYEASSSSRYATLAVLVYEPATGNVTYVNAGHNAPMLLRGDTVTRLTCGGPVLGLLPEVSFEQGSFPLEEDDLLLLYTDGITEQTNADGSEWDESGLVGAILGSRGCSAQATAANVLSAVDRFSRAQTQADDLTLLVLRRTSALQP